MANKRPSPVDLLFGPPGNPKPGVPTSNAVARKLGLDIPSGKSAHVASYKSTYPVGEPMQNGELYPMLREEMVSRLAQK